LDRRFNILTRDSVLLKNQHSRRVIAKYLCERCAINPDQLDDGELSVIAALARKCDDSSGGPPRFCRHWDVLGPVRRAGCARNERHYGYDTIVRVFGIDAELRWQRSGEDNKYGGQAARKSQAASFLESWQNSGSPRIVKQTTSNVSTFEI
jgi:hypothetical protein